MSSREEITLPATRPRSRKSMGHVPSAHNDQENMTADMKTMAGGSGRTAGQKPMHKSRSKSIGPGGLDALKDTAGNRRKSLAVASQPLPRSILKPTMPPLREIPAHISMRKASPKKSTPPSVDQNTLIDFGIDKLLKPNATSTDNLPNPYELEASAAVNKSHISLRTEEEQEAAAREREGKERQEMEKDINARRDARRKSLANRRVSFAPEATLHTWDVVVEYQDSTTSSNSTRRASSASGGTVGSPHPRNPGPLSSDISEPPSTPPEQVEENAVGQSPAHQRDLHQKKRRRSSGIPPMNFNNPDDEAYSSSPLSGQSVTESDEGAEDEMDDASNSNSDSEGDDVTTASIEGGEITDMSITSSKTDDASIASSVRLEESLRLAAAQAGTRGIDFDEHGDTETDNGDEGIIASFAPFAKKPSAENLESHQDQENINPFSPAFKANMSRDTASGLDEEMTMEMTCAVGGIVSGSEKRDDDEMSMDVTRAFGGIISNPETSRRKSSTASRRKSLRRRSSAGHSGSEDETMEFTTAIGGIHATKDDTSSKEDEDMTMEFTSVIGGVLPQLNATQNGRRRSSMGAATKERNMRHRESLDSATGDDTMDMTVAIGGIMPSISEAATAEIDAFNLLPQPSTGKRAQAKRLMELEANGVSSPSRAEFPTDSPIKDQASNPCLIHTVASETGSPSLAAFRGKGLRRSSEARNLTPRSKLSIGTPIKNPTTPSKQLTPQPARPTTPGKTPPSKNVIIRSASPRRLFTEEMRNITSTPRSTASKKTSTPNKLFQKHKTTGVATPSIVLTPQPRRSSGIGLDREGLGSPRVANLLDRRRSIGDQACSFVPSQLRDGAHVLRFADPQIIEDEIDRERAYEADKENSRKILEREVDQGEAEKDATLNLKEMISSLTPKKKSLKGRKSLHVGAAKGILGKRPVELDDDEDDEDNDGIKRLKGHQGSPVKNVKLQAPPSKAETIGRMTRATRKSLEQSKSNLATPTDVSPAKIQITTPHSQGRFRDAAATGVSSQPIPFMEKEPLEETQIIEESFGDDRIQLQDFLNMTNIRFMELTTTKRRHTVVPKSSAAARDQDQDTNVSLEDCVAAGAATIPMLELFQHACHELKNYISEGRKTVREIETETFEENPPLFREYISATADVKIVMDNQLKNVKTHARLLSKGMWYEWRMTLLNTLKDGLFKTAEGMIQDEEVLDHQQTMLNSVLPQLLEQAERLEQQEANLQIAAEQLANCDQEELSHARQQLIGVDADVESKTRLLEGLRKQLEGKEAEIETGLARKQSYLEEIREAEKIREECRGWTSREISALKAKVETLENAHGWTITGVSGTTTSMTYRREIELVFDAASFPTSSSLIKGVAEPTPNSRLDLWYIGATRELDPTPLTPDKEFFLQTIRDHIRGLPQRSTHVRDLLRTVSAAWKQATVVADNIRSLNFSCPTEVCKTSDSSLAIKSHLLIAPLATKVEMVFGLSSSSNEQGVDVLVTPSVKVVYGEKFNEGKMGEFLSSRVGTLVQEHGGEETVSWGNAVAELGARLLARGRK